MTEVHPFSDPEQVAKDLREFKATDWNGCTLNDVTADYIRRFRTLTAYPLKVKAGTILFRARKNTGTNSEPFQELKQLGLIPADKVTSFGRANIPGHSVFYCSNNEETVVKEVTQWYINDNGRAQDLFTKKIFGMDWSPWTQMMTISAWRVKEDLNLALLFGNETGRNEGAKECAINRYSLMNGETEAFNKSRNLIIDFFSDEFMQLQVSHESQYLYSALYAFDVMNNQPHLEWRDLSFDGVKYPSIANDFRGENYALSENAYKNKVEFLGANYCYTCNNHKPMMDVNTTALIGRVYSAIAKPDGELTWGESNNDFDYLAHYQGNVYLFTLANMPNRFSKAVVTLRS
jgi:hypothetical protein